MEKICPNCGKHLKELVHNKFWKCQTCKIVYDADLKFIAKTRTVQASLRETEYHCPACGEILKELVPNEYFLCEACDRQYDKEEATQKEDKKPAKS